MLKTVIAAITMAATLKSCYIGTGGAGSTTSYSPDLPVPWIAQEEGEWCGPASIVMWATYDGQRGLTQQQVASFIGTSSTFGSSIQEVQAGVIHFTFSGRDAFVDYSGGTDQTGVYFSREITSINNRVPLIAFVNGALHAVVASGGTWHWDAASGYNIWDSVTVQDPQLGPNQPFVAGQWTASDVSHLVSYGSGSQAGLNFSTYGSKILIRGVNGRVSGGPMPI
jgi:hypothetical protein